MDETIKFMFSKHGANMWSEIECNDLDLIEEKNFYTILEYKSI